MWRNPTNRYQQRRVWFERWIVEGYTIRQLAAQSGYSPRTLRRLIAYWLHRPPPSPSDLSACRHLLFDGTILAHRKGVFAVMDAARSPWCMRPPKWRKALRICSRFAPLWPTTG